jgi:hypothetical protein
MREAGRAAGEKTRQNWKNCDPGDESNHTMLLLLIVVQKLRI